MCIGTDIRAILTALQSTKKCLNMPNSLLRIWLLSCSGSLATVASGAKMANDLTILGAGQPIVGPEPMVELSYPHIKEIFLMWEKKKKIQVSIKAKGCKQAKALIGDEQANECARGLQQLNRQKAKTIMSLFTGHAKRRKEERLIRTVYFVGQNRKQLGTSSEIVKGYRTRGD